jgi:hypothetical protein
MKLLRTLLVAMAGVAAWTTAAAGEGTFGATPSGGLLAAYTKFACYPSQLADAGYGAALTVNASGGAIVRLTKISFTGETWINRDFLSDYEIVTEGGAALVISSSDLEIRLRLDEATLPRERDETYHGRLVVKDDLDWGPNEHDVTCRVEDSTVLPASEDREERALQIEIFGEGPAVDEAAYAAVKRLIGDLVADGTIGVYVISGHGIEGGERSCIELTQFADEGLLAEVTERFRAIPYDQTTTSYVVSEAVECSERGVNDGF